MTKLKMVCAASYIPTKNNDDIPLGQDAHFISAAGETIGVADGVGSWLGKDIDSGIYARELMRHAHDIVNNNRKPPPSPKSLLRSAFELSEAEGSTTACILSHRCGVVRSVNVGDSGFMLFRNNELILRSPTQQHSFNRPFQLGNLEMDDTPDCAVKCSFAVEEGDVLLVATDGFLDNVFPRDVKKVLGQKGQVEVGSLADSFTEMAFRNSINELFECPFWMAARQDGKDGKDRKGGKVDDITVIVAHFIGA